MGDDEYYLITYGINHHSSSGCSYYSLIIDVHPAVWLLKQKDCFLHAWQNIPKENCRQVRQIVEAQKAKQQRIRDEKELKQAPKKRFGLF